MKRITNFFTLASGVFGVIPGLTVLISNVGVPPNSSRALFSATIEALGVLTLMLLWMNKKSIQQMSLPAVTKISIWSILFFLLALFSYLFLYGYLIVDVPDTNAVFFPLWPSGELKTYLEKFGSKSELITQFGRDDVCKLIQSSSQTSLLLTTLLLLFVYQLIFVSLTFSFGMVGIKKEE